MSSGQSGYSPTLTLALRLFKAITGLTTGYHSLWLFYAYPMTGFMTSRQLVDLFRLQASLLHLLQHGLAFY